jgi:hypothetical protein
MRTMMCRISAPVLLALMIVLLPSCRRNAPQAGGATEARAGAPAAPASSPPGTVGPLPSDCYDTTHAAACPQDRTDPSGKGLPAHGGPCRLDVCRPCGSSKNVAFRDEHGAASAGFCVCVPKSDDSGMGTFSCYSPQAWKTRSL